MNNIAHNHIIQAELLQQLNPTVFYIYLSYILHHIAQLCLILAVFFNTTDIYWPVWKRVFFAV